MKKEKVIIYGTGGTAKFFFQRDFAEDKFELIGFCDGNQDKWNSFFLDFQVISPKELKGISFDIILIASVYFDDILKTLVGKYDIPPNKIKNIHYRQEEDIKVRYEKFYYNQNLQEKQNSQIVLKNSDKIVICTAITNGYDDLRDPLFVDERCEYICFTDDIKLKSDVWKIKKLPNLGNDGNRSAKQIKILTHKYFPEYQWSIWIDGKFQITGDLVKLLNVYAVNSHFLSFMHYRRNSVFQEAVIVKEAGFDSAEIIEKQMKLYRQTGFQDNNELLEGGVLFKKHNEAEIIRLMEAWWHEVITHSKRDQLSFNYCAWKEKVICDMIDINLYDNEYIKVFPHNNKKAK